MHTIKHYVYIFYNNKLNPTLYYCKMKTILITGGNGLVGSAIKTISERYKTRYNFIYLERKQCDLLNYPATLAYFRNFSLEAVFLYCPSDLVVSNSKYFS